MLSHLRIIYPKEVSPKNLIRFDYDDTYGMIGKAWHKPLHWDGQVPNYMPGMDIHIGIERHAEADLLGRVRPVPAQGVIRGEYIAFEPQANVFPWGWLVFGLRYDMQEGPEIWAGDWHQTLSGSEPGASLFCYSLEINLGEE